MTEEIFKLDFDLSLSYQNPHFDGKQLKTSLNQDSALNQDPAPPVKVSTDASKDGLGAVLLHGHKSTWFPVAYTSQMMNPAEHNYAQIDKETLGAVFGCEKL